jgi:hypothetical protein
MAHFNAAMDRDNIQKTNVSHQLTFADILLGMNPDSPQDRTFGFLEPGNECLQLGDG